MFYNICWRNLARHLLSAHTYIPSKFKFYNLYFQLNFDSNETNETLVTFLILFCLQILSVRRRKILYAQNFITKDLISIDVSQLRNNQIWHKN